MSKFLNIMIAASAALLMNSSAWSQEQGLFSELTALKGLSHEFKACINSAGHSDQAQGFCLSEENDLVDKNMTKSVKRLRSLLKGKKKADFIRLQRDWEKTVKTREILDQELIKNKGPVYGLGLDFSFLMMKSEHLIYLKSIEVFGAS